MLSEETRYQYWKNLLTLNLVSPLSVYLGENLV